MRDVVPTRPDFWLSGVAPTAAALLVAALLLVERLQTDLTFARTSPFLGVWWSILVVFGLAHIFGISPMVGDVSTIASKVARVGKSAIFLAANTYTLPVVMVFFFLPLFFFNDFDTTPQPYQQSIIYQVLVSWPLIAWVLVSPGLGLAHRSRWQPHHVGVRLAVRIGND